MCLRAEAQCYFKRIILRTDAHKRCVPLCIGAFRIIICLHNERLLIAFLVRLICYMVLPHYYAVRLKEMYFNFAAYIFIYKYIYLYIWYTVDACKITMAAPWVEMCSLRIRKIIIRSPFTVGVKSEWLIFSRVCKERLIKKNLVSCYFLHFLGW